MAIQHYEGELGVFDYDDVMFYIDNSRNCLRLVKDYKGPIDLPSGCINCNKMFWNVELDGCYLRDFDTSKVTCMQQMFCIAVMPEGFTLGDKFDTSSVTDMSWMFDCCELPKGFSLGEKFDTSNVTNMKGIFHGCHMPEDFDLGNKFNVLKVLTMGEAFLNCKFPKGFESDSCDFFEIVKELSKDGYDYTKIVDVPLTTLRECKTREEFNEVVDKFCKVLGR